MYTIRRFAGWAAVLLLLLWLSTWIVLGWPVRVAYFVSINLLTLGFYGVDKAMAKGEQTRVPELVLHGLALLGGSPAAWISQRLLRHKTGKRAFRRVFIGIVTAQALFLLVYWLV